jgi:hypothetical protein
VPFRKDGKKGGDGIKKHILRNKVEKIEVIPNIISSDWQ